MDLLFSSCRRRPASCSFCPFSLPASTAYPLSLANLFLLKYQSSESIFLPIILISYQQTPHFINFFVTSIIPLLSISTPFQTVFSLFFPLIFHLLHITYYYFSFYLFILCTNLKNNPVHHFSVNGR